MSKGKKNYVYVIAAESTCSYVKIGISDNPHRRIRQLQTGSPFFLFVFGVFEAATREAAEGIEAAAHYIMDEARAAGEWFCVLADEARDTLKFVASLDPYDEDYQGFLDQAQFQFGEHWRSRK